MTQMICSILFVVIMGVMGLRSYPVLAGSTDNEDSVTIEASRTGRQLYYSAQVPQVSALWSQSLREGNTCVTSKGHIGSCTSYRNCYPYFKIPDLTIWESWILGNYDTCSFFDNDGRQAFGVCCSNPLAIPDNENNNNNNNVLDDTDKNTHADNTIPGSVNKDNNYPNWPPPIPTHPPNHAAPTHPTVSGSLPGGSTPSYPVTIGPTTTTLRPATTWPTKPPASSTYPNWPPAVPTHSTQRPIYATTTEPSESVGGIVGACGAKNGFPDQERIVGGHNADPNEWPWIAVLFNAGRQFCGGSLIDDMHILTAAHCVAHMTPWDVAGLTVRLGDHNIKTNNEVRHVEKRIKRLVRHRGFDSRTLYNDIAVLTMDSPVAFSRTIKPICLPAANSRLYSGQKGTVIGWGSLRENGPQPAILQEVTIPIWGNQECRGKYGPAAPGGIIESMLCAGQAARDSCSGDSGGPLMVSEGSQWTQVGVVSWGIGCGKGQYPGVYTRVTHFLPWIGKNIKDNK